jgi:hypothetical protein
MKHLPRFHIKRFLPAANELLQLVQISHTLAGRKTQNGCLFSPAEHFSTHLQLYYFNVAARVELVNKHIHGWLVLCARHPLITIVTNSVCLVALPTTCVCVK